MRIHQELQNTVIMITHDVDEAVLLSDRIVMMTNGPSATIGQVVDVNLPRPRDRLALAEDAQFNHCRRLVLDFLYAAHRSPADEVADDSEDDSLATTVSESKAGPVAATANPMAAGTPRSVPEQAA